mmetsp:Transcript_77707/g.225512  ORF Transcript_77707/g.225512 Transcript_77707/m.225512 type:complete len:270 (-) Transcript_77707:1308-2117(-)
MPASMKLAMALVVFSRAFSACFCMRGIAASSCFRARSRSVPDICASPPAAIAASPLHCAKYSSSKSSTSDCRMAVVSSEAVTLLKARSAEPSLEKCTSTAPHTPSPFERPSKCQDVWNSRCTSPATLDSDSSATRATARVFSAERMKPSADWSASTFADSAFIWASWALCSALSAFSSCTWAALSADLAVRSRLEASLMASSAAMRAVECRAISAAASAMFCFVVSRFSSTTLCASATFCVRSAAESNFCFVSATCFSTPSAGASSALE